MPFLAAYIFWRRYEKAPSPSPPNLRILPGLLIILAALFLLPVRLIQEANPDWRLLSWAMALATGVITAGGVYLAGGLRWARHFAFPILFFFVAVPWPTQVEQLVIQGLMRIDFLINVEILNAIGIPAVQLGNVIEVGSGFVGIDEACTGIRSLQATFMVSLFLGEFYEFNVFRRIVLVVSGACLAFVCNLVRTFLLVWLGAEHGFQTIKNWHDPAGHTILMVCLLALWGLSMFLRGKDQDAPQAARITADFPRSEIGPWRSSRADHYRRSGHPNLVSRPRITDDPTRALDRRMAVSSHELENGTGRGQRSGPLALQRGRWRRVDWRGRSQLEHVFLSLASGPHRRSLHQESPARYLPSRQRHDATRSRAEQTSHRQRRRLADSLLCFRKQRPLAACFLLLLGWNASAARNGQP